MPPRNRYPTKARDLQKLTQAGTVNLGQDLTVAAKRGNVEHVDLLIKRRADLNFSHKLLREAGTPLFLATRNKNYKCMELLIKAGADVNKRTTRCAPIYDRSPLLQAILNNDRKAFDMLLKAGADVNIDMIFEAHKRLHFVELLLEAGIDPTEVLAHESFNCCYFSVAFFKVLIKAGGDVNVRYRLKYGDETLLHRVYTYRQTRDLDILHVLLKSGIKVNQRDDVDHNSLEVVLWFTDHSSLKDPIHVEAITTLVAAGENYLSFVENDKKRKDVRDYFSKFEPDLSLFSIARSAVRKHLLDVSDVNLFVRVPRLGLPTMLEDYLLYDVKLDNDDQEETTKAKPEKKQKEKAAKRKNLPTAKGRSKKTK